MLLYLIVDVVIAYILDLIFGDPYWMPHPVRFIGLLVKKTEGFLRKKVIGTQAAGDTGSGRKERFAGILLAVFVITVTFISVLILVKAAYFVSPVLFHIANIYFIYSSLAAKCLADEAYKVYDVLREKDIPEARVRLSMLVGRQTEGLNEKEIIRGVVETTAENTVDGVVSPLLYAVAGSFFGLGAPVVYAFKAISTLDSMVGYMNEKYINLGRASAKIDDAANFLPARLSGILIPLSALFAGMDYRRSFKIMLRDRRNHKSPNCAYSEAAVAGALGVRLGGANIYFGKVVEKPTIGDPERELSADDIPAAAKIMYVTSLVTLLICMAAAGIVMLLFW